MRKISVIISYFMASYALFAGDIATFTDIGFSGDSRYFMFAQYGVSDTSVYSDIYTVDVPKNSFKKDGVAKNQYPIAAYSTDDGTGAFYKGLFEIADAAKKSAHIIQEIASASDEQKSAMDQITRAIMELDSMTQQNAALVEETASASEEMTNQAQEMLALMKQFKINSSLLYKDAPKSSPVAEYRSNKNKTAEDEDSTEDSMGNDGFEKF